MGELEVDKIFLHGDIVNITIIDINIYKIHLSVQKIAIGTIDNVMTS